MTNAEFALRVSLIARISAQWNHQLVYGMWSQDFCAANAYNIKSFVEDIDQHLNMLRGQK